MIQKNKWVIRKISNNTGGFVSVVCMLVFVHQASHTIEVLYGEFRWRGSLYICSGFLEIYRHRTDQTTAIWAASGSICASAGVEYRKFQALGITDFYLVMFPGNPFSSTLQPAARLSEDGIRTALGRQSYSLPHAGLLQSALKQWRRACRTSAEDDFHWTIQPSSLDSNMYIPGGADPLEVSSGHPYTPINLQPGYNYDSDRLWLHPHG